jgi:hypothetical protein
MQPKNTINNTLAPDAATCRCPRPAGVGIPRKAHRMVNSSDPKSPARESAAPAGIIPTQPAEKPTPGSAQNPSSSVSNRLTQYLAFHSTMYCKVPSFSRIFVMQADQKEKTETKSTNSLKTIKPKYMSLSIKTFAFVAMLLTFSSTFATPTYDSNEAVKVAFHKDFKKAEIMATEVKTTYTKLTFKMNDVVMFAFYSDNGQLLAVTRNITSNQLPIQLLLELKKNYSDYWITDLFELTGDGASNYYITVENTESRITLRSDGSNNWELYEKKVKE